MEKRKEHPLEIHRLCVSKWKQGMPNGMISELLEIPITTVKGIIFRYQRHGHCANGRRTRRPRATKATTDRAILRKVECNRFISASVLAAQVNEGLDVAVRPQTIRNRIKEVGLNGGSARKKPYLKKDQKRKRLAYAKKLLNKFIDAKGWENVLYIDEASVQLHGNLGNVSVESPITHGVELDLSERRWHDALCTESVTGEYYRNLLHEEIPITRGLLLLPEKVPFVQDGAPPRRAKATKAVVKELGLDDLGRPPQSPDLNPIENLWVVMKRELHKSPASSIDDLKEKLGEIWYSIGKELVRKIVMSIPGRLESVVQQRGGHTKY